MRPSLNGRPRAQKKTPPKRGEYGANNLADQIAEFVHRIFLIAQQAI